MAEEVTGVPRDQYQQMQSVGDMVEALRAGDMLDVEEMAALGKISPDVAESIRASQAPRDELANIQARLELGPSEPLGPRFGRAVAAGQPFSPLTWQPPDEGGGGTADGCPAPW